MTVLTCSLCRTMVKGFAVKNLPADAPPGFAEQAGMAQAFGAHIQQGHPDEFGAIMNMVLQLQMIGSEVAGWLAMGYGVSGDPAYIAEREATRIALIARVDGLKKMLAPVGSTDVN